MINRGEIAVADLNRETRVTVLVLSNRKFHQLTGRALVAPEETAEPFPWRIAHEGRTFAVDLARTVSLDRLGDPQGSVSTTAITEATRAIRLITS